MPRVTIRVTTCKPIKGDTVSTSWKELRYHVSSALEMFDVLLRCKRLRFITCVEVMKSVRSRHGFIVGHILREGSQWKGILRSELTDKDKLEQYCVDGWNQIEWLIKRGDVKGDE